MGLVLSDSPIGPDVKVVGRLESVRERFYAISVEKRVKHPAVLAIADEARYEAVWPTGG